MTREDVVAARLNPLERALVEHAATKLNCSRSAFVRDVVVDVAAELRRRTAEPSSPAQPQEEVQDD